MLLDKIFRSKKDDEYYFFFNYLAGCWYFFNAMFFYPLFQEVMWGIEYSFLKTVIGFLAVLPILIIEGAYVFYKVNKMEKEEEKKARLLTQSH